MSYLLFIVCSWAIMLFAVNVGVYICGIIFVIDRIVYAVKKRQQKRIDDAFKEEKE